METAAAAEPTAPAQGAPGQTPDAPPGQQQKQVGHPLGGEQVKINEQGCIDFEQHCKLMVFCHKLSASQAEAPGK